MRTNRRRRLARTRAPYFPADTATWTQGRVKQWFSTRDIADDMTGHDFEAVTLAARLFDGVPVGARGVEGQLQLYVFPKAEGYQSGIHWPRPGAPPMPAWRSH